ncbi:hypothetical protein MESS4_720093 [Mesorhizobium sp. STM 4661]|nr:hypothetical protein MESS4_720093 [Mesorhizobium sp. STM 4661]
MQSEKKAFGPSRYWRSQEPEVAILPPERVTFIASTHSCGEFEIAWVSAAQGASSGFKPC